MTVIRPGRALLLAGCLALLTSGCGLAAELDRERDPARTNQEPPPPSSAPTAAPDGLRPVPTGAPEPSQAPDCPDTGVSVSTGMVSSAMGLRAMTVTLTNCGTRDMRLNGYPSVQVLDVDRKPMDVSVLKGTEPVTSMDDPGTHPVTLKPGDAARSSFVWRYSAVNAATQEGSGVHVRIAPDPRTAKQTVQPEGGLDIGDTGFLGTTAWQAKGPDGT